jgi:hypothetical protein
MTVEQAETQLRVVMPIEEEDERPYEISLSPVKEIPRVFE